MNITKTVESYINSNPVTRNALLEGMINYSKLSRKIIKENNLKNVKIDSIIVACRRYYDKYVKTKDATGKIKELVSKSSITIRDKIAVLILERTNLSYFISKLHELKRFQSLFNMVQSSNAVTLVVEEKHLERFKHLFKNQILKVHKGLVQITIESPVDLEDVPGHNAYIFSMLAQNSINIVEQMSCWTDTLIIIDEKDTAKAVEALRTK